MAGNALKQEHIEPTNHADQQRGNYATLFGTWAGWLFDALASGVFSFVLLSIAKSFNVQLSAVAATVSWFLLATGIGGYLLGYLADQVGRKKTIALCIALYFVGNLMCGYAHSLVTLSLFRILVGFSVGGLWTAAAALISEIWRPESRAKAIAWMQTGWSGGNLLAAILAWQFLDINNFESWRLLFIYSSIPAFLTFLYVLFFVKESPIWLANKAKLRQKKDNVGIGEIFKPQYLRVTTMALLVSIFSMIGYWIIITYIPTYLQSILKIRIDQAPVFLVWSAIGAIVGYILYGIFAEKVGRRMSFFVFFIGMAIMVPVFTYTASHMPLTNGKLLLTGQNVITLGIISSLLGFFQGYFSGFGAWYSELFPTSVRSTATGFCFNFGRVGAILGIELVPVLIPIIGFTMTISLAALTYIISAALVFTLRETKGEQLT
jgi:MFS family permease